MSKSRNFCFTLNNYVEKDLEMLAGLTCRYLLFGKEVGDQLTPHLQGFVVFENPRSFKSVVKDLTTRCHVEICKGSAQQNMTYCKKAGDFVERGVPPISQVAKGEANVERWEKAREAAKRGDFDSIPADIYMRTRVTCHAIYMENLKVSDLDGNLEHEWWYGAPGTGKTRRAKEENPSAFVKDPQTRWWDGYTGQDVVIIDDFDKYQVSQGGDMKRWLDRYVFQAPIKGGYMSIRPRKIIVTSNYHPDSIWEDEITQAAIGRRVTIVKFGDDVVYPIFASTYVPLNK